MYIYKSNENWVAKEMTGLALSIQTVLENLNKETCLF